MTKAAMTTMTTVMTTPMAICEPLLRPELAGVSTLTPAAAVLAGCIDVAVVIAGFVEVAAAAVEVVGLLAVLPAFLAGSLVDTVVFVVGAGDCDDVLVVDSRVFVAVTDCDSLDLVVEFDTASDVLAAAAGVAVKDDAVEVILCSCVSFVAVPLVLETVAVSFAVFFAV